MPVRTRNLRSQALENDENSQNSARLTRAKATSLTTADDSSAVPTKALPAKKSTTAVNATRKRAALGDVSNVTKVEAVEGKKQVGKTNLISKAAQPTGIQKTTAASRTALANKQANKKVEPPKRSGAGSIAVPKRKVGAAGATIKVKEEASLEEGEPLRKKAHTLEAEKRVKTEKKEQSQPTEGRFAKTKPIACAVPPSATTLPYGPSQQVPAGVQDLDRDDLDDPVMVAEYAGEIFEYLRDLECKSTPNPDYMVLQDDLEWKTRGILIDWLIEVHTRFHLLPETLFLAVNIIDRFLSEKVVQLDRLQLVGVTAMFIASKYEEVMSPHIANFVHVADDGFTEAQILSAERCVLQTLEYDLSYPNPMNFLRRISKADDFDIQSRTIGKYLMEISLLDHRFMAYRPSHVAAGAMYLARMILDRGEWDETLEFYAGYSVDEIEPACHLLVDYLARPITHEAFFKKYASKKFLKVSILTRQWAKRNAHRFGILDTDLSIDQL